jgi:uncharacterized protein (TIGR03067 family)
MGMSLLLGLLLAGEPPRERAEPQEREELIKAEVAKLQGEWKIISAVSDGDDVPLEQLSSVRRKIEGNKYILSGRDKGGADRGRDGAIVLDPTKTPKHCEMKSDFVGVIGTRTSRSTVTVLGIYELDGETQKECLGTERPTDFSCKKGSKRVLIVWKKVKVAAETKVNGTP